MYRWDTTHAIQSSVNGFLRQGQDANITKDDELFSHYGPDMREPDAYLNPGLWNIPVCLPNTLADPDRWETAYDGAPAKIGVNVFFDSLNRPDTVGNQQT